MPVYVVFLPVRWLFFSFLFIGFESNPKYLNIESVLELELEVPGTIFYADL